MKIDIDSNFSQVKSLEELTKLLTRVFEKLHDDLHAQPNFLLMTSADQEVPKNTAPNTVVFQFDETDIVKTGYYNGDEIVLP